MLFACQPKGMRAPAVIGFAKEVAEAVGLESLLMLNRWPTYLTVTFRQSPGVFR